MTNVICDKIASCREPQCGGRMPHEHDIHECGHCPKDKAAKCVEFNIEGWDKLTPDEKHHILTVAQVVNTEQLKETFAAQKALRHIFHAGSEPYWDCKHIALKLGYEV